jgi:DedD protein
VERQLKERLIGAAVLVAIAVIMVPEMFSGPRSHSEVAVDSASASSGQIKTYQIELQSAHSGAATSLAAVQEPVAQPAAQPRDETPPANERDGVESSGASSSASAAPVANPPRIVTSSSVSAANESAPTAPKPAAKPKPESVAETSAKPAMTNKQDGEWVVQVGSFGGEDKARQIVAKLKGQGQPAYLGKVTVGGKTLYRVRVGTMPSRAAADAALQKIKASYPEASVAQANR